MDVILRSSAKDTKGTKKKTKLINLGISEGEKVLGNEKIDQVDSFTYLGSIISKDGGCRDDAKNRIARPRVFFHN